MHTQSTRAIFYSAVLLISITVLSACATADIADGDSPVSSQAPPSGYQAKIESLLRTFDGIVTTSELDGDINAMYLEVRKDLAEGRIRFRADNSGLASSLQRSRFSLNPETGMAVIFFHSSLLDELETNPVPALGEYAGLLANLRDFREYGAEVSELYADPLEYYLANMDRSYLQAQFLRDYAIPLYGEQALGEYEYYLLQGLEVDGFSSHSLFVWGIDKDIIYSMLGLSTQVSRGQVELSNYVSEVLELGREIRGNLEQSRRLFAESGDAEGDDGSIARRNMYIAATSANSYRTLGSVIFSSVVGARFSEDDYETYSDDLEEINELYSLFSLLLGEVEEFRSEYKREYLDGFVAE